MKRLKTWTSSNANFFSYKDTPKKMKSQAIDWKKYLQNISDIDVCPGYSENSHRIVFKKTSNPIIKWAKDFNEKKIYK